VIIPWKRFWVPLGAEISWGMRGDGFLDDPDSEWNRNYGVAKHLDTLASQQCLVLSGEPTPTRPRADRQVFGEP
jgi:hypothetical protein